MCKSALARGVEKWLIKDERLSKPEGYSIVSVGRQDAGDEV